MCVFSFPKRILHEKCHSYSLISPTSIVCPSSLHLQCDYSPWWLDTGWFSHGFSIAMLDYQRVSCCCCCCCCCSCSCCSCFHFSMVPPSIYVVLVCVAVLSKMNLMSSVFHYDLSTCHWWSLRLHQVVFFLRDPPNAINDMTGGHVESSSVRGIPWYTSVPNNHWDIHIVDPVEDPIASVSTSFIAGRYCRYSTSIEGWFVIGTFILYAIVGGKRQTLRWRISRTSESPGPNAQVCTFPDVILYPLVI